MAAKSQRTGLTLSHGSSVLRTALLVSALLVAVSAASATGSGGKAQAKQGKTTSTHQKPKEASQRLEFLKQYNEKYPYEVQLLKKAAFTKRLKRLVGSQYNLLVKYWNVQTPIEVSDSLFVSWACKAHDCANTNFIVVYDFTRDVMWAGVRIDGVATTYSENGTSTPKIAEWGKD